MRLQFHQETTPAAQVTATTSSDTTVLSEEKATDLQAETATNTAKAKRTRERKRTLTPQELRTRNRRRAALTLAVSLVIGGRWYVANQAPTYPKSKGVYAKSTAPEWGKLKQPNAATFYMAAADALDLGTVYKPKSDGSNIKYIMEEPAAVQKPYVERAQPALTLLRQGMQYPYVRDYQTNFFKSDANAERGFNRPVPNYIALREMTRILAAESNVRASEGNYAGAMESSIDAIRLGVDVGQGHSLIDGMIGVLIQGIGAKEGVKHIAGLNASEARTATARLETTLANAATFAQMMTQDRDVTYEFMQDTFRTGDISTLTESNTPNQFVTSIRDKIVYSNFLMYYTKQGLVNDYAGYMNQIIGRGKMPYYVARQLPPLAESANPVVRMAIPNYQRALSQTVSHTAWNRVFLAKLALQGYRAEHGNRFPTSLAELTMGTNPYLSAVPVDPYSKTGKEPLRYKARTGDVYSVGEDGIDNNGAGDDNADLYTK